MSKNSRLFVEGNEIEIVEIEIVEKHAEGTALLYRVSTGILKKPLGSSRFSSRLLYVVSTYVFFVDYDSTTYRMNES